MVKEWYLKNINNNKQKDENFKIIINPLSPCRHQGVMCIGVYGLLLLFDRPKASDGKQRQSTLCGPLGPKAQDDLAHGRCDKAHGNALLQQQRLHRGPQQLLQGDIGRIPAGPPNNFKTPTNYAGEGYWHIVINTLKCEAPSKGPGSTGSIWVCTEGLKDNRGLPPFLETWRLPDVHQGLGRRRSDPLLAQVQRLQDLQQVQGRVLGSYHQPMDIRPGKRADRRQKVQTERATTTIPFMT